MKATDAYFYKKDLEHTNIKGEKVIEKDVLHFRLLLPHLVDKVDPIQFDDRATAEHKKNYAQAYNTFLASEESPKEEEVVEAPVVVSTDPPVKTESESGE